MAALKTFRVNWLRGVFLLCSVLLIVACGGSDSTESTSSNAAPTATIASAGGSAASASSGSTSTNVAPTATVASTSGSTASAATSTPQATPTQASSSSGGRTLSVEEALDQLVVVYEELLIVLASVTDEASARAAVDEMTIISSKFEYLDEQMKDFSEADITAAFLTGRVGEFSQELTAELIRISSDPEIFKFLAEAFENFNLN